MKRFFDIILSFIGIVFLFPIGLVIAILGLFDTGKPLFVQKRMGKDKKPFNLYKFRSMRVDTQCVPSHHANHGCITSFGKFLRKSKLDEIPQLINVLKGDMSLVGARPVILSQTDVIEERDKCGIYNYLPGVTGLAQINGIDTSNPKRLVKVENIMYKELTIYKYFLYIFSTATGKGIGKDMVDSSTTQKKTAGLKSTKNSEPINTDA